MRHFFFQATQCNNVKANMQHHHRHKNIVIVVTLHIIHQVGQPIRIDPVKTLIMKIEL